MTGSRTFLARIVRRADTDPKFRALLLTDPKAAVEAELQIHVPEQVILHVIEEREGEYYILLPPKGRNDEPSDEEAQSATGGMRSW